MESSCPEIWVAGSNPVGSAEYAPVMKLVEHKRLKPSWDVRARGSSTLPRSTRRNAMKRVLLDLLKDCYEDELAHLELRMIRDAQQPRFEALKESHPEIYRDFMAARVEWHEILLKNRKKRVEVLTSLIEG